MLTRNDDHNGGPKKHATTAVLIPARFSMSFSIEASSDSLLVLLRYARASVQRLHPDHEAKIVVRGLSAAFCIFLAFLSGIFL